MPATLKVCGFCVDHGVAGGTPSAGHGTGLFTVCSPGNGNVVSSIVPCGSAPKTTEAPCAAWKLFVSGFGVGGGTLVNDAGTVSALYHTGMLGVVCHSGSQQKNTYVEFVVVPVPPILVVGSSICVRMLCGHSALARPPLLGKLHSAPETSASGAIAIPGEYPGGIVRIPFVMPGWFFAKSITCVNRIFLTTDCGQFAPDATLFADVVQVRVFTAHTLCPLAIRQGASAMAVPFTIVAQSNGPIPLGVTNGVVPGGIVRLPLLSEVV